MRWVAPLLVKYSLSDINLFLLAGLILISSSFPFFFTSTNSFYLKKNSFPLIITTLLTTIHYLGNFYGIIMGNIVLTTLIIKNAPFFQTLFYSYKYNKPLTKYDYFFGLILIIGICLLSIDGNNNSNSINFETILIPLISAICWAYLMIFIGTIKEQKEILSIGNWLAGILIFWGYIFAQSNFSALTNIARYNYLVILLLGISPTFLAPLLWSYAIKKLGNKIIYFDYITPIITILWSIILFETSLNNINIIGIFVIFIGFIFYQYYIKEK